MFTNLIAKKKRLLRWISNSRYEELIEFVSSICLADADLIILIARKCSNLCAAMLPFALAENGGALEYMLEEKYEKRFGRKKKKKPVVITDRALHLLKDEIRAGQFKEILVVDDLIIHGRTLEEKCEEIEKLFSACGLGKADYHIQTRAFAKCATGLIDVKYVTECRSLITCHADDWKSISDDIVSVLHICGVAYTSYVPNMVIQMDSEVGKAIERRLQEEECFRPYGDYDMSFYGAQAYVYVDDDVRRDAVWSSSIRIYSYPDLNQYLLIPLMTLNPVDGKTLNKYVDSLSEVANDLKRVDSKVSVAGYDVVMQSEEIIAYREVVYLLSALEGWRFIRENLDCSIRDCRYEVLEEQLNFAGLLLKDGIQVRLDREDTLISIMNRTLELYTRPNGFEKTIDSESDIKELSDAFHNICDGYTGNEDEEVHTEKVIGKFMWRCGKIDEARARKANPEERTRLFGYPLSKLADAFSESRRNLVESILYHTDRGAGSIVARSLQGSADKYFFSVVHEGEQNYRYYLDNYFTVLYGFYYIETEAAERHQIDRTFIKNWKSAFLKAYEEKEGNLIFSMDQEDLLDLEVCNDYRTILLQSVWVRNDDEETGRVLDIARETMPSEENTAENI